MPKTKEFRGLLRSIKKTYLSKPVPKQYQTRYGKRYDLKDVNRVSYAVAKSKGIRIDK